MVVVKLNTMVMVVLFRLNTMVMLVYFLLTEKENKKDKDEGIKVEREEGR